jgi:autotransporter-associated beta strand protein
MKPKFWSPSGAMRVLSLCALSLFGVDQAGAAITWKGNGNGANAYWDQGNNWSSNSSLTNQDLLFSSNAVTCIMNASYAINSITFGSGAGAFTLTSSNGAILTLGGGGIVNSDDSLQSISFSSIIGLSAAQTWSAASGALTVTSGINNNGNLLTVNAAYQTVLSGLISGNGGLTKTGASTLVLGGSSENTYSGTTTVSAGTLEYAGNNAIGTGAVSIDGASAILSLGAYTDSVGTVTVANGGSITGSGTLTSTGTFEMQSGSVSANLAGAGALNKTTGGTVTLTGASSYTGATTISNGTLTLSGAGAIANSQVISLSAGAGLNVSGVSSGPWTVGGSAAQKLAGQGTVTGSTRIGGSGTHAPGGSAAVGTQTFAGALNYASGSIFEWDLSAASTSDPGVVSNALTGTYDKVVASGAVTGGSAVFKIVLAGNSFTDAFWNTNKSWTDIFGTGSGSTALASIFTTFSPTGGLASNGVVTGQGQFSFTGNTLNWTAVPEPTSALVGVLIGAGLLRRRRL